jgi:hypothetical protein
MGTGHFFLRDTTDLSRKSSMHLQKIMKQKFMDSCMATTAAQQSLQLEITKL